MQAQTSNIKFNAARVSTAPLSSLSSIHLAERGLRFLCLFWTMPSVRRREKGRSEGHSDKGLERCETQARAATWQGGDALKRCHGVYVWCGQGS